LSPAKTWPDGDRGSASGEPQKISAPNLHALPPRNASSSGLFFSVCPDRKASTTENRRVSTVIVRWMRPHFKRYGWVEKNEAAPLDGGLLVI
jgi:hypothetical protein